MDWRSVNWARKLWRALRAAPRGFVRHDVLTHASALSFDSVLALVPLLALAVATMKGLGGYDHFSRDVVQPWLTHTFEPATDESGRHLATLRDAFIMVLELVEKANLASLGIVGLVTLLYVVWALLRAVERSLNHILSVRRSRSLSRTLLDYAAILFITPMCVVSATILLAGAGLLDPAFSTALEVVSVLIAAAGLTFLYLVMPNARVPLPAAVLGGLVSGTIGYAAFLLQVYAQVGVLRYNALYSGFAAIPLFLLWVFLSWLAVLLGAEVAAAHADPARYDWNLEPHDPPFALREHLALHAFARLTDAYVNGRPMPTTERLASEQSLPKQLTEDVLEALAARGLLARSERAGQARTYVPARDIDTIRVSQILEALRQAPGGPWRPEHDRAGTWPLLKQLRQRMTEGSMDVSARQLAARLEQETPGPRDVASGAGNGEPPREHPPRVPARSGASSQAVADPPAVSGSSSAHD